MNDIDTIRLPKTVFHVNDEGEFTNRIYDDKPMENTMYWRRKNRLISVLIGVPVFVMVIILLAETNMLQEVWTFILSFWYMFWGLFF